MTPLEFAEAIRREFEKLLATKTGWGRNELLQAYDQAVARATMQMISFTGEKV